MCARRFLMFVVIMTLLVVGAAFAIYQWGGNVLLKEATPKGHFAAPKADSGPNYRTRESWIARPDLPGNPADWLPQGLTPSSKPESAVFYIHPTTYLDRDRWNAPIDVGGDTEFRRTLFVQSQASAFNQIGEIWAPRYRQAAYGAFLLKSDDAEKALDLAYRDVTAAFDQFVREAGNRPIILAGHSQGALHLERLLKEKVAGQPIAKRVVAAYVVGWPISTTADLAALGLPACTSRDQAGCILSWMTFGDPPNPDFIFDQWQKTPGFNGGERRREDTLCVNPISGIQNGAAAPRDNPGTLVPTPDLRSATLDPGVVGAHCQDGLLILDGQAPGMGGFVLPGNNYHAYDYALFWGAIRRDATTRLSVWNADQQRH
ncbi:MAG: hypothetical protein QOD54_708 [Sphingomonadales bacterium]|nr:hypothetical protein [Sphingomonadales bacterium]